MSHHPDEHDRASDRSGGGPSQPSDARESDHARRCTSGRHPARRRIKRLLAVAGCVAAAGAIVGCGAAGSVAREIGVAACRQAASSLSDPQARQIADQACQAGASGSLTQATQAAKQAAHDACLGKANRIVDPTARQQIAALCPTAK